MLGRGLKTTRIHSEHRPEHTNGLPTNGLPTNDICLLKRGLRRGPCLARGAPTPQAISRRQWHGTAPHPAKAGTPRGTCRRGAGHPQHHVGALGDRREEPPGLRGAAACPFLSESGQNPRSARLQVRAPRLLAASSFCRCGFAPNGSALCWRTSSRVESPPPKDFWKLFSDRWTFPHRLGGHREPQACAGRAAARVRTGRVRCSACAGAGVDRARGAALLAALFRTGAAVNGFRREAEYRVCGGLCASVRERHGVCMKETREGDS